MLSNPKSTGNIAQLSRIRDYCADHPDIFHYEVERAEQIGDALRTIARVRPKMLIINGGDGPSRFCRTGRPTSSRSTWARTAIRLLHSTGS